MRQFFNIFIALLAHTVWSEKFGIEDILKLREVCLVVDVSKAIATKPQEKTHFLSEV